MAREALALAVRWRCDKQQVRAESAGQAWRCASGSQACLGFGISPSGAISFTGAPDFEAPSDSDTNNTYTLVIEATDASGNTVRQTVTVTVTDVDDTAPVISGPGGAGQPAAAISVPEGTTAVTTLTASETVTWAIVGGDDAGRLTISQGGAIAFVAPTDFENPADANRNNTYILQVRAVDRFGNASLQTITVTVANTDEITRKLDQIGGDLRGNVRDHAFGSLTTMLAFNEGLLSDSGRDGNCVEPERTKAFSGSANATERAQQGELRLHQRLNACQSRTRFYGDAAVALSRFDGNWTARTLASLRVEYALNSRAIVGAAVVGSMADDRLNSFKDSRISDRTVQLNAYGRVRLSDALRFAAFGGVGKAWYDFSLSDGGLALTGKATGDRYFYGAALSGDIPLAGFTITTDAILSRAVERLGGAALAASYLGENRSDIAFAMGTVDVTRLSVPVHIPVTFGRNGAGGSLGRVDFSPGFLCEDTSAASSSLTCGYQVGLKLLVSPTARIRVTGEVHHEKVEGYQTELLTVGAMYRFGPLDMGAIGIDVGRQMHTSAVDNRVMVRFKIGR